MCSLIKIAQFGREETGRLSLPFHTVVVNEAPLSGLVREETSRVSARLLFVQANVILKKFSCLRTLSASGGSQVRFA